jgi:hypothetical protein
MPGLSLDAAVSAPGRVPIGRFRDLLERDLLAQSVAERLVRPSACTAGSRQHEAGVS